MFLDHGPSTAMKRPNGAGRVTHHCKKAVDPRKALTYLSVTETMVASEAADLPDQILQRAG